MDQQHYKPLANNRGTTVTNYGWSIGGTKTSADNYQSYVISACKIWYVYHRKPEWFGQFAGDRYIGKRRWLSINADGTQHHCLMQKADIHGMKVVGTSESEADRIANDLMTAKGFLHIHDSGWMRRKYDWYLPKYYRLEIRCAHCHMTRGEHERTRSKRYMDLKWTHGMADWDAFITARESVVCRCAYEPRQDVIQHCIETGDGLKYD